ncbi:uncharacterized protein LOC34622812 [Cyclospora cayetanensis]|uniref:Uncharacterized protein LOC34622812 n=1 Tax=Cyclospora cayetanensis TaxID=88456 RepID=A0A6P6S3Q9_9EIME|nr:uncharacterized protein LOC34622812 [Cyclospora cayetanensis]
MADGRAAPQACEQRACLDYGDLEDGECWMPFHRSAPDTANGEAGWDLGGFVSPFQCVLGKDPGDCQGTRTYGEGCCLRVSPHAQVATTTGTNSTPGVQLKILHGSTSVLVKCSFLRVRCFCSLGCGDGRFVIECCRLANCNGVGLDLDEKLVAKAQRNAAAAGTIRAEFFQGNFLDPHLDLSRATVM